MVNLKENVRAGNDCRMIASSDTRAPTHNHKPIPTHPPNTPFTPHLNTPQRRVARERAERDRHAQVPHVHRKGDEIALEIGGHVRGRLGREVLAGRRQQVELSTRAQMGRDGADGTGSPKNSRERACNNQEGMKHKRLLETKDCFSTLFFETKVAVNFSASAQFWTRTSTETLGHPPTHPPKPTHTTHPSTNSAHVPARRSAPCRRRARCRPRR